MKCFISGLKYEIGDIFDIDELLVSPEVTESDIKRFRNLGLKNYSKYEGSLASLYVKSISSSIESSGFIPESIDAVIPSVMTDSTPEDDMEMWKALHQSGLNSPAVFGLGCQESATFGGAIDLAKNLVKSGSYKRVLILVGAIRNSIKDRVTLGGETIVSDGAASCIVSDHPAQFEILSTKVISNPKKAASYKSDLSHGFMIDESIRMISEISKLLLGEANLKSCAIDKLFCTNANDPIYTMFSHFSNIDDHKVIKEGLRKYGHVNLCDNAVDISSKMQSGGISMGENLMLLNWARNLFSGVCLRYL
ncbi:hypothetical protein CEE45_16570 [Candidatus Heimdallarchaeota archaeon B3_Heim]|nr:MAG: hypothetical protein CEE45_16570 [Candidatus Heimdallarchaeota archaeon B3_Heim]